MKAAKANSKTSRRGAAMVEMAFAMAFLIPLLLGTFVYGFRLIRSIQMSQITRDIGHMYIRGINFRNPGPVSNAQTLASGFSLTTTGTSVVILSKIRLIGQAECDAANATISIGAGNNCANKNKAAFVEQLKIGNPTGGGSAYGTPTPLQADYTVTVHDQGLTASAVAASFLTILNLQPGEYAYVAEMVNNTPDLNIPGFSGQPTVYARTIF
jgi:Flp pilus assembly protein TadG